MNYLPMGQIFCTVMSSLMHIFTFSPFKMYYFAPKGSLANSIKWDFGGGGGCLTVNYIIVSAVGTRDPIHHQWALFTMMLVVTSFYSIFMISFLFHISEDYKHRRRKRSQHSALEDTIEEFSDKDNDNIDVDTHSPSDTFVSSHHIHKRSVSMKNYVEVMVVADYEMLKFHGDNLQHYILTLMSIVSMFYYPT